MVTEENEWRFGVEEVGDETEPSVEPESPTLEGTIFFLLGAAVALYTFVSLLL